MNVSYSFRGRMWLFTVLNCVSQVAFRYCRHHYQQHASTITVPVVESLQNKTKRDVQNHTKKVKIFIWKILKIVVYWPP